MKLKLDDDAKDRKIWVGQADPKVLHQMSHKDDGVSQSEGLGRTNNHNQHNKGL